MDTANPGLSTIGQIAVTAQDVERATSFYRDKLGMRHIFSVGNMAFFDCDGIRLMLSVPEGKEFDHASSIIYFKVDDIQESFRTFTERGVRFEEEPAVIARMENHDLWMAFFRDSENNVLALMSEAAKYQS